MATDVLTGPTILGTATRTKVFKNFIDGEWVEASTGETFENRNPADTRDLVGIFQKSGKADVDAAVEAAKRAFEKWRLVPAPRRAEILYRASELLIERKEDFSRDMTREMGKILKETRGDVQEAIDTGFFMAGEGYAAFCFQFRAHFERRWRTEGRGQHRKRLRLQNRRPADGASRCARRF